MKKVLGFKKLSTEMSLSYKCATLGGRTQTHSRFCWEKKPKRRRLLGRPKCRWEDTVEVDLQRIECETVDGIDPAQDREKWTVVNAVTKCTVFVKCGNFLTE